MNPPGPLGCAPRRRQAALRRAMLLGVVFTTAGLVVRFAGQTEKQDLATLASVPLLVEVDVPPPVRPAASLGDVRAVVAKVMEVPAVPNAVEVKPPVAPPAMIQPRPIMPRVQKLPGPRVMFDGRPLRRARTMTMTVTAYSPDEESCGPDAHGITASGYSVWTNGMKLVAADTRLLPFGSLVSIPGYNGGQPVPVLDRGGAIKGRRLDVLFPTDERAREWGVQKLDVVVWEYAD